MRFGEIGGGVIIRTSVYRFSVSDSPNGVGLSPQLRQAAASLAATERTDSAVIDESNELDTEFMSPLKYF